MGFLTDEFLQQYSDEPEKFSITHFTDEEFKKYKEMHENENTKIHRLLISFWLDPYKEVGYIEMHKSRFCMVTAVKEDVKSGEVKIFEEIFEKFETQEQMTFEVYGYSGDARLRGEELKVNRKNFLIKGVYQTVETSFSRNVLDEFVRDYYVVVYGKLLDDDF